MSNMTTREILNHMPFHRLSNFEIETNFQSAKLKILNLMDNHNLTEFIKENLLDDLFNPNDVKQCNYFDEEKIDNLNRTSSTHLNIFFNEYTQLTEAWWRIVMSHEYIENEI